jgi:biopolymer transport protein ExbD
MQSPRRRDVAVDEPGMTSMIDVVFLLLVFFVWTSSFDQPEFDLASQIAMPASSIKALEADGAGAASAETPEPQIRREEIVVRIIARNEELRYMIGAVEATTLAELKAKLKTIAGLQLDPIVIVDPDDKVPMADCIAVFDEALLAGLKRVLFAVE